MEALHCSHNSFTVDYYHLDTVTRWNITQCAQVLVFWLMRVIVSVVLIHIRRWLSLLLNGPAPHSHNHGGKLQEMRRLLHHRRTKVIHVRIRPLEGWFWLMIASFPHYLKLAIGRFTANFSARHDSVIFNLIITKRGYVVFFNYSCENERITELLCSTRRIRVGINALIFWPLVLSRNIVRKKVKVKSFSLMKWIFATCKY